jgi:putative oxidoreductase
VPHALFVVRVVAGLLFWQHGLEKLFGFAGARPETALLGIRGIAGILEAVGGPLLVIGLCTRPTAFILSGEMAVAYFRAWAPRGFFPIANGGEEATLNAFIFLWLARRGRAHGVSMPGCKGTNPRERCGSAPRMWSRTRAPCCASSWTADHAARRPEDLRRTPSVAGRVGAPPLALDSLPAITGALEIVAGPLLMAGLFVRQAAWVVAAEALVAYLVVAQPRALWPIRNGGIEALLYAAVHDACRYLDRRSPRSGARDARRSGRRPRRLAPPT